MVTVVLGKRGSGKSEYVKRNILPDLKTENYIIFDPLAEYGKFGVICESFPEMENYIETQRAKGKKYHAILRFEETDEWERAFYLYKLGNLTMLIEEIDWHCSPLKISPGLEKNLKYGRHYNCDIVAISRRPAEINRLITSQAQLMIVFEITEPKDIEYLKKTGFDETEIENRKKYEPLIREF
jgi:hypothetical protein